MFESMLAKAIQPKQIIWDNPKKLDIKLNKEDPKYDTYEILKGAETFLHKQIDIKPSTSKEIFKKAEEVWKELKDIQLQKCQDNPDERNVFSLTKKTVLYLVDDYKNLIDIIDVKYEDAINEFKQALEKFTIDISTTEKTKKFYTEGKGGLIKLVCYDSKAVLPEQDYTPIVLIEFNNIKSTYIVYTGILIYRTFTFIPSISYFQKCDSLSDFIQSFNLDDAMIHTNEKAEELYNAYKTFEANPVEVSARELISILKKVGYKLELKTDDELDTIQDMTDEESNTKIQRFFNTFKFTTGETAYDILSLSELKKIFRYNKLTLLEVLEILSKEYLSYEGVKITGEVLSSLVYNLFDKQNDKRQAESIKKEIE